MLNASGKFNELMNGMCDTLIMELEDFAEKELNAKI